MRLYKAFYDASHPCWVGTTKLFKQRRFLSLLPLFIDLFKKERSAYGVFRTIDSSSFCIYRHSIHYVFVTKHISFWSICIYSLITRLLVRKNYHYDSVKHSYKYRSLFIDVFHYYLNNTILLVLYIVASKSKVLKVHLKLS
jgi:hypothetical protein